MPSNLWKLLGFLLLFSDAFAQNCLTVFDQKYVLRYSPQIRLALIRYYDQFTIPAKRYANYLLLKTLGKSITQLRKEQLQVKNVKHLPISYVLKSNTRRKIVTTTKPKFHQKKAQPKQNATYRALDINRKQKDSQLLQARKTIQQLRNQLRQNISKQKHVQNQLQSFSIKQAAMQKQLDQLYKQPLLTTRAQPLQSHGNSIIKNKPLPKDSVKSVRAFENEINAAQQQVNEYVSQVEGTMQNLEKLTDFQESVQSILSLEKAKAGIEYILENLLSNVEKGSSETKNADSKVIRALQEKIAAIDLSTLKGHTNALEEKMTDEVNTSYDNLQESLKQANVTLLRYNEQMQTLQKLLDSNNIELLKKAYNSCLNELALLLDISNNIKENPSIKILAQVSPDNELLKMCERIRLQILKEQLTSRAHNGIIQQASRVIINLQYKELHD